MNKSAAFGLLVLSLSGCSEGPEAIPPDTHLVCKDANGTVSVSASAKYWYLNRYGVWSGSNRNYDIASYTPSPGSSCIVEVEPNP